MLVDLFNGGFMGNPSRMEVSSGDTSLLEVIVVFTTDTGHGLLEAGQLVLEVLHRMMENV